MIYLDNSATTKMSDRATAKMMQVVSELYGNPSSLHNMGLEAEKVVSEARNRVLKTLGVSRGVPGQLIFTSGGTEANNLAILGAFRAKKRTGKPRVLISSGEHSSVEECARQLEKEGAEVVRIPTRNGVLDKAALEAALTPNTFMISLMLVNNETGAVYDVKNAFSVARRLCPGIVTHCDAVQGYMKVKFTPAGLGADLVTVSAHKIGGPKGVGALYVDPAVIKAKKLVSTVYGGGQEWNLRSGTENVYGIAAFGEAAMERWESLARDLSHMAELRDRLEAGLASRFPHDEVAVNRPAGVRAPHIVNLRAEGIRSETMLHYLSAEGVFVSSGSACSSHGGGVSRALSAFGLEDKQADSSLRVSFSPDSTAEEIEAFLTALAVGVERLQKR